MRHAVVIRHVHFEDVGAFAHPLAELNYDIRYLDVGVDDIDHEMGMGADLLMVLGAPIGAYEEALYPFLDPELNLLRNRIADRRPTLGICLGAQLMAKALGAEVRPGPAKEIGWAPVDLTDVGRDGPLRHLADIPMLHWHGDYFELPPGAVRLASTRVCRNQAFALGPQILGFQFHPENDGCGFERWLIGHAVEIARTPGITVPQLRDDARRFGAAAGVAGQKCIRDWLTRLP